MDWGTQTLRDDLIIMFNDDILVCTEMLEENERYLQLGLQPRRGRRLYAKFNNVSFDSPRSEFSGMLPMKERF